MCIVATYVDIHQFSSWTVRYNIGWGCVERPPWYVHDVRCVVYCQFLFFVVCCHCVRECVIGVVSLSGVLWCCVCCGVCVCCCYGCCDVVVYLLCCDVYVLCSVFC